MGILWPHSNTVARTNADRRAPGALAYFFEAGTTTPRTTYQDADLTTPHAHPVVADAYGRFPAVFIDFGSYRERVKTAGSTQLWDTDDIPNPAPFDEDVGVDGEALLSTGDVFFRFKQGIRPGSVRANGDTIGSAASGAGERANADTLPLYIELYTFLSDAVCPVIGGRGANAAADFAADKKLTLPDLRGGSPFGLDDMGFTAAARFSLAIPGYVDPETPKTPGITLGGNTATLDTTMMPSHTHSFSATTGSSGLHSHTVSGTTSSDNAHSHTGTTSSDGDHSHTPSTGGTAFLVVGAGAAAAPGIGANATTNINTNTTGAHTHTYTTSTQAAHTHTFSAASSTQSDHTHTVSGTSGSVGSGAAHNNLARAVLGTWYIKL